MADAIVNQEKRSTTPPTGIFLDELNGKPRPPRPERTSVYIGLTPRQSIRVLAYIEEKLDTPLPAIELASVARLSSSYFCRAFKASFGNSPHAFILSRRIERAKHLMVSDSTQQLAEIALNCGLADQAHLSRLFRKHTGETPNAWRRKHCL